MSEERDLRLKDFMLSTRRDGLKGGWKDAYESQSAALAWIRSDIGRWWRGESERLSYAGLHPKTREMLSEMYDAEEDKLIAADPIYVSEEMGEVIVHAAQSFEPEPILPSDFICEVGYCHLALPVVMPDRYEKMVALGGFSWQPIILAPGAPPWDPTGIIDGVIDPTTATTDLRPDGSQQVGVAVTLYSVPDMEKWESGWGRPPPRLPIHHTPWYFGMSFEGNEIDEIGARTGTEYWWKVCQTTLRLMQQRLARRTEEIADRATRRREQRKGFDARPVVVVRLRRESGSNGEHESDGTRLSHRFIVSGHWRQQWYPSIQGHRQIWISPYVKGPEDQPLVVKPRRVYTLER